MWPQPQVRQRKKLQPPKSDASPWKPPKYDDADAHSIRALHDGSASPEQQQRALNFIINSLACTYDLSYRPGSDRDTAFAEGKRFVGLQIVKFLKVDYRRIKQETGR